jgi:hypothetical protein
MPPPLPQSETEKLAKTVNYGIKIWLGCFGMTLLLALLALILLGGFCAAVVKEAEKQKEIQKKWLTPKLLPN